MSVTNSLNAVVLFDYPLNIVMTEINSSQQSRLSLIEWAKRMALHTEDFAELMHDVADYMVIINPEMAARFYHAADLTRIEVDQLRQIIPRQSLANCILFGLGVFIGFLFGRLLGM